MTPLAPLDAAELTAWLTRVTQAIDRSLRDTLRAEAVAQLSADLAGARVGLPVLAQLALLDDCLRVAHEALELDGTIDADELARIAPLVSIAAQKYFQVLPRYESFDDGATSPADVERFLVAHRADPGAFGHANATAWRGLQLARTVERHTRNAAPLRDLERMLVRIMDAVFHDRATELERAARRRLRDLFEPPPASGQDPRATAFCRADAPEVFSSIAHGSQIHERDPYDVESIHAEAREVFHRLLVRATTPEQHQHGHGRTLLVLGDSGSGKTHLLRALRHQVHAQRLGYVGYLQLTSDAGDYARYVLRNFIDSLERPYDAPVFAESGLLYLSDGLAEGRADIPRAELEALRTEDLLPDELGALVGGMIDRILRTEGLAHLEVDLVHALLLLQRRDPALQRRVIRFLRCEQLTAYEQRLLGGLAPRGEPDDPIRTIRQLGAIAYELQLASIVFLVDQVEDSVPDGTTVSRLQAAIDVLRGIADAVPSSIIVLSCLDDVYSMLRPRLSRSLIDRIERDPAPVRLSSERQRDEIEAMLVRRLDHLYATFDVALQDDDPLFPFAPEQIDAVRLFRARDALASFREFHEACVAAGAIERTAAPPAPVPPPPPPDEPRPAPGPTPDDLDRAWNDALAGALAIPEDDAGILELVADAIRAASDELGHELALTREGARLFVEGKALARRVIEVCNGRSQGGHLGSQLDALRGAATAGAAPIALRNSDFVFKPKTKISKQVGELIAAGGRAVVLEERQLRAIGAARAVAQAHPHAFDAWKRANRPISHLGFVREILDLDSVPRLAKKRHDTQPIPEPRPPAPASARTRTPSASPPPGALFDPTHVRLGETTTMRKDPVRLPLDQVKAHVAFLGTPGSGKTTAALATIEQLLERGVSVLLVDRKGDLARYASATWWAEPDETGRRAALRDRLDVALFTPGQAHGRPLRLPLVPSLADATTQERVELAKFSAAGLAAMMGYGTGTSHRHKQSVLQCAIQLHAEDEVTIDLLRETIQGPDPELLTSAGPLQRFFAPLAEDLQALGLQRGSLLGGDAEPLDMAALLPPPGGRPRLSILYTGALTEISVLQFWVSRLVIELARLARTRPAKALQGVAFFDEADAYVPAVGAPPTKGPMFELLRRAGASGFGLLLATQNPGDFDYKARDLVGTWLAGKVAEERAIDKMRNLLASYPSVGPRLATQPTGHFFLLANGSVQELKADAALMTPEPLADHDVIALARAHRP